VLSLDLAAGGHLSHGLGANLSGRWFDAHHYGVQKDTGIIDYKAVETRANEIQPKLLIAGGSAYPRALDFERLAAIAKKVGSYFLVDMAHIAGLVAGGVHASPIPHADIVTCTTTKTLRGPRGGLILSKDDTWRKRLQSAVFPGVQGSLHTQVLAAKAVCLGEALQPCFRDYAQQVVDNAATLSSTLQKNGIDIVSGGTDTHIALLDLSSLDMLGREAEALLDKANITCNKNPIPFDVPNPNNWSGLRLGVSAATTRGFKQAEFEVLGRTIAALLTANDSSLENRLAKARETTEQLCAVFPIY
jgi:glycine hydroxymethyltransferase